MKRSTRLLLSVPLFLLFVIALLLYLFEFNFQRGEMTVESSASTYAFGEDVAGPAVAAPPVDLYLRVPAFLEARLVEALEEALAQNAYVGPVNFKELPPAAGSESVLVLTMEQPQMYRWTPLYAQAGLTVDLAYASDGEVAWIGEKVVTLTAEDKPDRRVVRLRGDYSFDYSAYGLLSRPGFVQYLADEMSQTVNETLANTLAEHAASVPQE